MAPPHASKLKKSASTLSDNTALSSSDVLLTEGKWFRDSLGRVITLRGVNLSGATKLPAKPLMTSHRRDMFFDHKNVSFVGRPFPLEEADEHLARLKSWGFNFLRFLVTWEAIEHSGPGLYDVEYFDYVVQVLLKAKLYGFRCFIDPHQDVWSRFTGGSGAPGWTLDLVGLDMELFDVTRAALVHNTYHDPENFPRMIWPTNYSKLACSTMFTLFFGGKSFAPRCMVNQGKMSVVSQEEFARIQKENNTNYTNIQDYLQEHYCNAIAALIKHISQTDGLLDTVVVGCDSLNEPSGGFLGVPKISEIPAHQILKNGETPTPLQSMLLGQGVACDIEYWDFGPFGPQKNGKKNIDPSGTSCWKQDKGCIWEAHGIYDKHSKKALDDDYFFYHPGTTREVDWISDFWRPFVRLYTKTIRAVHQTSIIFVEPPVNEIPPLWDPSEGDPDSRICFTPHWYDGITLMNKHFSTWWTIDYTGYTRGKYSNILAALSFGLNGIKKSFGKQLNTIRSEGLAYIGETPFLLGEIGIPYDMDKKKAYSNGNYKSQIQALDANLTALELNNANFTLWNYCSDNNNKWGDNWNGEDLSIFCRDTKPSDNSVETKRLKVDLSSILQKSPQGSKASRNRAANQTVDTSVTKLYQGDDKSEDQQSVRTEASVRHSRANTSPEFRQKPEDLDVGGRAIAGFLRPYATKINGEPLRIAFDYLAKNKEFKFTYHTSVGYVPRKKGLGTEIYIPKWHFGRPLALHLKRYNLNSDVTYIESENRSRPDISLAASDFFFDVKVSSGSWTFDEESQILHVFHGDSREKIGINEESVQEVTVTLVTKKEICKRLGVSDYEESAKFCSIL